MSNHTHYEERLSFINKILQERDLEASSITPILYEAGFPFPYNNFTYLVELSKPTTNPSSNAQSQPGTLPLPPNTTKLILRLTNSNPKTGLNPTNRVENETAAIYLARQSDVLKSIVPEVYAWASAGDGKQGWMMMQYLSGEPLDEVFESLSYTEKEGESIAGATGESEKEGIVRQLAEIFKALQSVPIPSTVTGYGGMTFDQDGSIVGGELTAIKGGPFETHTDLLKAIFASKLDTVDKSEILHGWAPLRPQIDSFVDKGIDELMAQVKPRKRVLVHCDFTMNNMQYDRKTKRITGLLDFDWAHISHPLTDHLTSFSNRYARMPERYKVPGWDAKGEDAIFRKALKSGHGFLEPLPSSGEGLIDWTTAALWDKHFAAAGALRFADIPSTEVETLASLFEIAESFASWGLTNETMVGFKSKEDIEEEKIEAERRIKHVLGSWESGRLRREIESGLDK
jgi:aminoglycoside phosphotransferase (APT) family kinase protein